ncbi:6,7-dimethyl-8-ribityllumazine synthase [Kiloniella antarctica]|uniref:6,7-dimethyl-8-ribityllumazine synthase n=1 Tax=Kiloniella antarctica TaxID=1550907 RepID=A0ABW5BR06_9PROT
MNQNSNSKYQDMHFAFIQAQWHSDIVGNCRKAFLSEIEKQSNGLARVEIFDVPGALEIPLVAKKLAKTGRFSAIVGTAFVVDGGIYRHDFVSQTVISGMMQAQMDTDIPVLSAILTPHHFHNSEEHLHFFLEHFKVKGKEVADACLSISTLHQDIARTA